MNQISFLMVSVNVSLVIEKLVKILLRIPPLELVSCTPAYLSLSLSLFFISFYLDFSYQGKQGFFGHLLSLSGICFTGMSKCRVLNDDLH